MLVEVTGSKPLRYGGKKYKRGEFVDMSKAHARTFIAIRRVRDLASLVVEADPAPVPVEPAEPPKDPAVEVPKPKRQYRRRDMTAEG